MMKRNLNRNKQRGNMGGYIMAILVIGGGLTVASRLGPLYMDHNTMSNLIDKLAEENGMGIKSDRELNEIMKKRLKLNNIRDFPIHEHVEYKRTANGTELVLDYEVRLPLVANVDMVASFNKQAELRD